MTRHESVTGRRQRSLNLPVGIGLRLHEQLGLLLGVTCRDSLGPLRQAGSQEWHHRHQYY